MAGVDGLVDQAIQLAQVSGMSFSEALAGLRAATDLSEASVERARAVSAEGQRDSALARNAAVQALVDRWAMEAIARGDDDTLLTRGVVDMLRVALADPEGGNQTSSGNSTQNYAGSSSARQSVGLPGHCERCAQVGHVAAHRNLGCGDVGCNVAHGPEGGA